MKLRKHKDSPYYFSTTSYWTEGYTDFIKYKFYVINKLTIGYVHSTDINFYLRDQSLNKIKTIFNKFLK